MTNKHAPNYLTEFKGIKSWLFTLDHKRIGIMYLVFICFSFFSGWAFCSCPKTGIINPWHLIFYGQTI